MLDPEDQLYEQAKRLSIPDKREQISLARRAQRGDTSARNELVTRNIRLVYPIARFYQKRNQHVEYEDIVQAGIEGMIKATHKFNPDSGNKFTTYATFWVRKYIVAHVENTHSRLMRVPKHVVADYTNSRMTQREADDYRQNHLATLSPDAPSKATGDDRTIGEAIQDDAPLPDEAYEREERAHALMQAVNRAGLDAREMMVITYLHGLQGAKQHRQADIARMLGIREGKVAKIKAAAYDKIRHAIGGQERLV